MSTIPEIESAISKLSLAELAELQRLVQRQLQQRRDESASGATAAERVLGLHKGVWSVADDFDAPLSDNFWLGTDA
jgi:hypothetical protein